MFWFNVSIFYLLVNDVRNKKLIYVYLCVVFYLYFVKLKEVNMLSNGILECYFGLINGIRSCVNKIF